MALNNIYDLFWNGKIKKIATYEIINHDGISSDSYRALKNGTYTFTVRDLLTSKTYTKTIDVNNIDESILYYIECETTEYGSSTIYIIDKATKEPTTFTEAYVMYEGQEIDVSSKIGLDESTACNYLAGRGISHAIMDYDSSIDNYYVGEEEDVEITIVKDGVRYREIVNLGKFEPR